MRNLKWDHRKTCHKDNFGGKIAPELAHSTSNYNHAIMNSEVLRKDNLGGKIALVLALSTSNYNHSIMNPEV
jgi:hypothetical protein